MPAACSLIYSTHNPDMKKYFILLLIAAITPCLAVEGTSSPYTDAVGDIDPGIANAGGTLDILGMEVTNDATNLFLTLTLNGDISATDWGKFMIGFSTGSTATINTGNGWGRPIQLNSPLGGMDYWIGSLVDSGGESQLWSFDVLWTNNGALPGYSLSPGTTSTIAYTVTLSSLGLSPGDTFYFDAYSSGGGGTDSAVDALANPNVSITAWSDPYTSSTTANGGVGLNSYLVVPEPTTIGFLALAAAGVAGYALRRRSRA